MRRIAYLINQYPAISHTFIRREIVAIEQAGVHVARFAIRGWDETLAEESDLEERSKTRYLLQRGIAPLLISVGRTALSKPVAFVKALKLALHMSRGSDKRLAIHLGYLAQATVLDRWIAQGGYSHLHAHFATNAAQVALLTHTLGGPPFSFTAHGSDIMDRPAQMSLPEKVQGARFVVAVCAFGRNQIFRWIPRALWPKISIVRCGLDSAYGATSLPVSVQTQGFVCVGRLSKEKGQSILIDAVAHLRAKGRKVAITLIGDGPMRVELEQQVNELRLRESVQFLGWADADRIQAVLKDSLALVVPSLSEGLPVVIMEAMASQRTAIAPMISGIPELVMPGKTGWLFAAGDHEALAQAMAECMDTRLADLVRMGATARQTVLERHDVATEARKLLARIDASDPSPLK